MNQLLNSILQQFLVSRRNLAHNLKKFYYNEKNNNSYKVITLTIKIEGIILIKTLDKNQIKVFLFTKTAEK